MSEIIKLAIVDDHFLFRKGLLALLQHTSDFEVIIEAANGKELIDQLNDKQPHVVLLDIQMPVMDGIKTTDFLRENFPNIKIVILSMHSEDLLILDLIERGANGYLKKNERIEKVIYTINSVMKNESYFEEEISLMMAKKIADSKKKELKKKNEALSEREVEIIKFICEELSNKEIADKLFLSHRTIDNYREKLMQKIGAKNTAGVVLYALKNNLINPMSA